MKSYRFEIGKHMKSVIEAVARQLPTHVDLGDERTVDSYLRCGIDWESIVPTWPEWRATIHEHLPVIIDRARALRAEANEFEAT